MGQVIIDLSLVFVLLVVQAGWVSKAFASKNVDSSWKLPQYLGQIEKSPESIIQEAERLYHRDALADSKKNPSMAYAWQDRLAVISALSNFFDPSFSKSHSSHLDKVSSILLKALANDPSLLVRDGVVESMRRINRMRPGYIKNWKSALEAAFLDEKNHADGEGYFIRETILSAMRESAIVPSRRIKQAASADTNLSVRSKLSEWKTSTF